MSTNVVPFEPTVIGDLLMPERVAIFGGGVAGLSAAHELNKRGFSVEIYEASGVVGGKARSLGVPCNSAPGKPDLPGEHGFRFFPGFYKHLPATMKEIPVDGDNAYGHLVDTEHTLLARSNGEQNITTPNKFPTTLGELIEAFKSFTMFYCDLGVPKSEVSHFIRRLLMMLVSCDARRFQDYERKSWFKFIDAASMSQPYQDYLAKGLSRSLVALNANDLSARTGGCILLQFLLDFANANPLDRVLDLPTNDAWLGPWETYLCGRGVCIEKKARLESFQLDGGLISGAQVTIKGAVKNITADYYVAALPVEVMKQKLAPLLAADPSLGSIKSLCVSWMTGIIFYLNRDIETVRGHVNYLDSNWALTSISQPQFWTAIDLGNYGDGNVHEILSVIISNWDEPLFGTGKSAKECTEQEVKDITWEQLKNHLNTPGETPVLADADLECVFLAPCLTYHGPSSDPKWTNKEPLFINTKNSWKDRPTATTGISNFFLASDYVKTFTDLATMESANEAARHAVNGILKQSASSHPQCEIWPLTEPALLDGYRVMDSFLFSLGLEPLVPPFPPLPWPCTS